MRTSTRCLLLTSLLCLAMPATALAQDQPPLAQSGDSQPTALSDEVFRAAVDRRVVLHLIDGREVVVRVLAIDPEKLIVSENEQVKTLARAAVTAVRLLPYAPPQQRNMALNLGLAPAVDFDLDLGLFHGFANLGVVLALATRGASVPLSVGLGVGIPVSHRLPALKLDVFAHVNFVWDVLGNNSDFGAGLGNWVSFGAGLGLHYTWSNGFTMGFTVPLMGYSVIIGDTGSSGQPDAVTGIVFYYLTSSESLPLLYFGYRF